MQEETTKANILVIEDEMAIAEGLVDLFIFKGYQASQVADGNEGLKLALSGKFDLIILDIMLPGLDGFSVCNAIREKNRSLPIIILSAKTSETDIIEGLKLGADDYVNKPFSVGQLFARVDAVLRRSKKETERTSQLQIGNMLIKFHEFIGIRDQEEIPFTRKETEILEYLSLHLDRPVSRQELLKEVWGYDNAASVDTRTVDIHITKLRKKIEKNPGSPKHLVTIRGEGYQLRTHVNETA